MLWIKRNLFLVVSGLVVAVLLGLGGFYLYSSWSRNATVGEELEKNLAAMTNLYNTVPFPHPTNVTVAREYIKEIRAKKAALQPFFEPVPAERVTGLQFRSVLDKTLSDLQRMANQAAVELPRSNYGFSFDGVRNNANFDPGSFPLMPQQLADIKAISTLLFEARVRPLINIRRARVSRDDKEAASDYLEARIETDQHTGAILSPFEFEFQCMSEGLAEVLDKLARSPHGFLVRALRTEPVDEKPDGRFGAPPGTAPDPTMPGAPVRPGGRRDLLRNPPGARNPTPAPAVAPAAARGRTPATAPGAGGDKLVTPLKERRIKVTLNIVSIRPAEK
jgi:hypothetical protein